MADEKLYLAKYLNFSSGISISTLQHQYMMLLVKICQNSLPNRSLHADVLSTNTLDYQMQHLSPSGFPSASGFAQSALNWKNTFVFQKQSSKILLSFQGTLENVLLKSNMYMEITTKWMGNEQTNLSVSLLPNETLADTLYAHQNYCTSEFGQFTRSFEHVVQTLVGKYILARYVSEFHPDQEMFGHTGMGPVKQFNWKEASDTCGAIGGQLPSFLSRRDQEELLFLVKIFPYMYKFDAMFINLIAKKNDKVVRHFICF